MQLRLAILGALWQISDSRNAQQFNYPITSFGNYQSASCLNADG
jgi:hypothetical protein